MNNDVKRASKKLSFAEIINMAGGYYKYAHGQYNGVKGTYYWMCQKLSDKERERVESCDNAVILTGRCQYAPELKSKVIFHSWKPIPELSKLNDK